MAIKSSERTALTRILNRRFDVLEADVAQRRDELALMIRDRIRAEAEENVKAAVEGLRPLIAEAKDLERRVREYEKRCRKDLGVRPGSIYEHTYVVGKGSRQREVKRYDDYSKDPIKVTIEEEWAPLELQKRIDEAIQKLATEAGGGKLNLARMRADLEEKILLGEVESEDARKLLAEIPEIDAVLPPPEDAIKALSK